MGSGSESHEARAQPIGRRLAAQGVHLLTGGGGGVMEAVSRAFVQAPGRRGSVIGVLPSGHGDAYPNPWVEIPVRTHLPLSGERGAEPGSRNHINVLTSDAIIALPGGAGTASEVRLALAYGRPLVAYLARRDEIPGLPAAARVESDLERVMAFVAEAVG